MKNDLCWFVNVSQDSNEMIWTCTTTEGIIQEKKRNTKEVFQIHRRRLDQLKRTFWKSWPIDLQFTTFSFKRRSRIQSRNVNISNNWRTNAIDDMLQDTVLHCQCNSSSEERLRTSVLSQDVIQSYVCEMDNILVSDTHTCTISM